MRIHVRADAETEDAHVAATDLLRVVDNLVFGGVADRRPAIGEEDDDEGPVGFVGAQGEGLLEGVIDGGAAEGLEILDERLGAFAIALRYVGQFVK